MMKNLVCLAVNRSLFPLYQKLKMCCSWSWWTSQTWPCSWVRLWWGTRLWTSWWSLTVLWPTIPPVTTLRSLTASFSPSSTPLMIRWVGWRLTFFFLSFQIFPIMLIGFSISASWRIWFFVCLFLRSLYHFEEFDWHGSRLDKAALPLSISK